MPASFALRWQTPGAMMSYERSKAMQTFFISLRVFKHPLTLLSIALLLLNDHMLKGALPSWLTGKLSDFAGLFFFPFLLCAALSPLRLRPRQSAGIAFGITAIWFAAMKTMPAANHWTQWLAGVIVGKPVRLVLDPTDLIALVALVPAWWLWLRLEQPPPAQLPGKWAYAALGLAALASVATAPCFSPSRVMRVIAFENSLFARLDYGGQVLEYAKSEDGGQRWEQVPVDEAPDEVAAQLAEPATLPVVVCDPAESQHCYRVNAEERVEESNDGGANWQTAWEIPPGRRDYMERWLRQPLNCRSDFPLEMGPYDIAFFKESGRSAVVVAMGYEGALVDGQSGQWERLSVLSAGPTPFDGASLFITLNETLWSLGVSIAVLLGYSAAGWRVILRNSPDSDALKWLWFCWGGVALFVVCAALIGALGQIGLIGMLIAVGLVLFGLFLTWNAVANVSSDEGLVWLAGGASLATAIAVYFVPTSFFDDWAAGRIAVYADALIRALGISIPVGIAGLAAVLWLCSKAAPARSK